MVEAATDVVWPKFLACYWMLTCHYLIFVNLVMFKIHAAVLSYAKVSMMKTV